MRIYICFILFFTVLTSAFTQEVIVKEVWGNVEFVVGKKRTIVKNFASFSDKEGVFVLKDSNSQLFIRVGDRLDLLIFSDQKNEYSILDLITKKENINHKEDRFLNKFFSLFNVKHSDDVKIDGMIVSEKSGISRNLNDTNIILLEDIMIIEGYPLKIDFSGFIKVDNLNNNEFSILINNKWSNKNLYEKKTNKTYFDMNTNDISISLGVNWKMEISNFKSSRVIRGGISSFYLNPNMKNLLNKLRDKALLENKTDNCTYQIIFIESLMSKGLLANARFYLDYFMSTNNNSKLIRYRNNNLKY